MDRPKEKPKPDGIVFAVLRIIAAVICAILLNTFLFTIALGQANPGSVTGSIFCIAAILLVIFYPLLKKKKPLLIAARAAGICMCAFALYCGVICALIVSEMTHGEERALAASTAGGGSPQTVIVLGCKTDDGVPSQMLRLRLDRAVEYLNDHPDAVCIVTGGQGADEIEPEAVSMHRCLIEDGISDERIYVEDKAKNTAENIKYSSEIIKSEGLSENVVIVSECYHLYRGVRQARLSGFDASGVYPDPSTVMMTMPSYWLREIYAITRDLIFG